MIQVGELNEEEMAELARRWPNDFGPYVDRRPLPPPRHGIQRLVPMHTGKPMDQCAQGGCKACMWQLDNDPGARAYF